MIIPMKGVCKKNMGASYHFFTKERQLRGMRHARQRKKQKKTEIYGGMKSTMFQQGHMEWFSLIKQRIVISTIQLVRVHAPKTPRIQRLVLRKNQVSFGSWKGSSVIKGDYR